jgi:1-acyl-sn-glycerol-3-phosphate acyltransferase
VTYIAKADYFVGGGLKRGFVRWFLTNLGHVPVKRGARRAAMGALEQAGDVLANSGAFAIYPEGTRSPDGRLYRGRTGIARLTLMTGAPVVPFAMVGTDKVQPGGKGMPRIAPVTIRFGRPLDFSRYDGMDRDRYVLRAVTDEVMSHVMKLSGQEYVDIYATKAKAA